MTKKIITLAIVSLFIFSTLGLCADKSTSQPLEKTKDRLSNGVDNIFYGPTEVPNNLDETKSKGTKIERCTEKTRSGVERGIARLVGGVWQVATFWYSDPDAVTSTKSAARAK